MTIGERIKAVRIDKGLTQEEFARQIGFQRSAISSMESSARGVTTQTCLAISKAFGVSPSWLRDGEGDMYLPSMEAELDALANRYALSPEMKGIIRKLAELPKESQDIVAKFIISCAHDIASGNEV